MTAPNVGIVTAVQQLQAERDALREVLRTVIAGVPDHAKYHAVHLSPDVLAEIRRLI